MLHHLRALWGDGLRGFCFVMQGMMVLINCAISSRVLCMEERSLWDGRARARARMTISCEGTIMFRHAGYDGSH